jgi:hypothetical protein
MNALQSHESSEGPSRKFYEALSKRQRLQATDPRDKVFVLCSIQSSFAVDYGISVRTLYCAVFRKLIGSLKAPLSFLGLSGTGYYQPNDHNLPSWTPDLSKKSCFWPAECRGHDFFATDLGLKSHPRITEGDPLITRGCKCDVIIKVELFTAWRTPAFEMFVKSCGWERNQSRMYPTGITRADALLRTLLLDYNFREQRGLDPRCQADQARLLCTLALD